ncbi:hypothetical protein DNTS_004275 [Danionella cerebrum]|uniref:EF-hand domain-containing protein n=1 Tax=Danionella cerebrum TaxID=2873325 RepID=A0A553RI15_9TELE|nr:hypothetical protein DNTS_004275 [Danionella translucida]
MFPVFLLLLVALTAADEPVVDLSEPVESGGASISVVHCDASTVCPDGTTCCLSPFGVWVCCPYPLGQCCRDGRHCCPYGYYCDSTSTHCLRGWMRLSSSPQPASKATKKLLNNSCCKVNKAEIECLIRIYNNLLEEQVERRAPQGLERGRFRNMLHNIFGMTDDMMIDRVCRIVDKDNDGCLSIKEWVEGLSVFLRGTLEEKIKYCFEVYDLNGDGYISREEMFQMLKDTLVRQPTEEDPDEGIKDIVEIALKKMDHDHDGKVSYADFEKTVLVENLLLESFGNCLPDTKSKLEFEQHLLHKQQEHWKD